MSDDSDSDDGNNGDFRETKPFTEVRRRGSTTSRSTSSRPSSTGSWTPPTPIAPIALTPILPIPTATRNSIASLTVVEPQSVAQVALAAQVSWNERRFYPVTGENPDYRESVTDRICREIDEARAQFVAHPTLPTAMAQDTPPGLEVVPVSCYSGSFRTWAFDHDLIAEFDAEDNDDDYGDEDDEIFEFLDNTDQTEHFFIDQSPDNSKICDPESRVLVDCAVQTDITLSINAANIKWTPSIVRRSPMSSLERAIRQQRGDELPAHGGQD